MTGLLLMLLGAAPAPPDEGVAEGRAALHSLEERHRSLEFLSARYVQERRTPLMRRPLRSEGRLAFRRAPGCLVFRTEKPKETVLRLDETTYQVYRPAKAQLEKFLLEEERWQKALFQTLSHQVREIEKDFEVLGSEVVVPEGAPAEEARRLVRLRPRSEKIGRKVQSLEIGVRETDSLVTRIAYRDAQGDHIAILLHDIDVETKLEAETFRLEVPEGTKVIVHEVQEDGSGP